MLTILGIELDSVNQVARLPAEKLEALRELIALWLTRTWCNRQELESLIGHLHHAVKVVWPGQFFLLQMIDLLCCFQKKDHPIHLNKEFHCDLQWWHQFLIEWQRVSFWLFPGNTPAADVEVSSDTAGSLGFGAYVAGKGFLVHGGPRSESGQSHIRNYFPWSLLLMPGAISGAGSMFCFARTTVVWSTSCFPGLPKYHALCICYVPCYRHLLVIVSHSFSFSAQHIPGVTNSIADVLSCFHWQDFHRLAPEAHHHPTPILAPQLFEDLISTLD